MTFKIITPPEPTKEASFVGVSGMRHAIPITCACFCQASRRQEGWMVYFDWLYRVITS